MIIRKEIDIKKPLTEKQKEMLGKLENASVVPDEDCPELTYEQLARLSGKPLKNVMKSQD